MLTLLTDTAILLHQLQPERSVHQRAGCESWSCTWSGDGSMLAWSCGNHIVKLIPWNRCKHCMYVILKSIVNVSCFCCVILAYKNLSSLNFVRGA